jgi:hypothetical protein
MDVSGQAHPREEEGLRIAGWIPRLETRDSSLESGRIILPRDLSVVQDCRCHYRQRRLFLKGSARLPPGLPGFMQRSMYLCNPSKLRHLSFAQGGPLSAVTTAIEREKDMTRMLYGSQTS